MEGACLNIFSRLLQISHYLRECACREFGACNILGVWIRPINDGTEDGMCQLCWFYCHLKMLGDDSGVVVKLKPNTARAMHPFGVITLT